MDNAQVQRLTKLLEDIRARYGDAREIVRGFRAREASDTETAYWIGVAQSFSKQATDDLMALHDAIDRIEAMTRPKK